MKEGSFESNESQIESEVAFAAASERLGAGLAKAWAILQRNPASPSDASFQERVFWFRPQAHPATRIEVDAFDYGKNAKRSFWVRLILPGVYRIDIGWLARQVRIPQQTIRVILFGSMISIIAATELTASKLARRS